MNRNSLLRLLAAALFALGLPGCGQSGPAKTKVAFVTNNPATFWNIAEAGCRKAEAETGVEVIFRKPDPDPAKQKEIIDILLSQDIKAIAVSVINPSGQKAQLNEVAAKVPLITQDNDAPETNRLCYLGTNNYAAGRAVGQLVKEAMPDGGTIAIFVGQLEPLNARQRRQGVLDELADRAIPSTLSDTAALEDGKTYSKYRLHKTYTDQGTEQRAKENATDALTELTQEKSLCFIGLWAYNPPAILSAVKDQNKTGQVKIVGFDEHTATLQGIADGFIQGTVVQDPFGFGYQAVKIMAALAKGDKSVIPADKVIYVPHRVITKDGGKDRIEVAKFRADLEAILGKSK